MGALWSCPLLGTDRKGVIKVTDVHPSYQPRSTTADVVNALSARLCCVLDAATVTTVAQHLATGVDVGDVAARAVQCVADNVTGTQYATVTACARGVLRTVASTDPAAAVLDRWLATSGQGPVWSTTSGRTALALSANIGADSRWTLPAIEDGAPAVQSVLTVRLPVAPAGIGWALNAYSGTPNCFDDNSTENLRLLSIPVAGAMTNAYNRANLQLAVATRDVIGQAKGVLMERYRLDADRAFELLRRVSQSTNCKIYELAEQLAHTGQLPETGRTSPHQPPPSPAGEPYNRRVLTRRNGARPPRGKGQDNA